jgi:hypothetical protein
MEWPLPLWKVLSEELAQFKPASASTQTPSGTSIYQYRAHDIIDSGLLRCQLDLRLKDLRALITTDSKTTNAAKSSDDIQLEAELASMQPNEKALNLLLEKKNLYEAFTALAEAGWIKQQHPMVICTAKWGTDSCGVSQLKNLPAVEADH